MHINCLWLFQGDTGLPGFTGVPGIPVSIQLGIIIM